MSEVLTERRGDVAVIRLNDPKTLNALSRAMLVELADAVELDHAATTFMDLDQYALATTSEDYREAIKAFLEKRGPKVARS